ncbi:hypothetical protein tb265_07740 [Gemmatimonadetes bacterium T265]|nr:hypothetical protein tb265_07740 [Gemmatimonadetes bacterium T265]
MTKPAASATRDSETTLGSVHNVVDAGGAGVAAGVDGMREKLSRPSVRARPRARVLRPLPRARVGP